MKAISVQQPWAWAIAQGHKPVENRRWRTHHRGRLAIHAPHTVDCAAYPVLDRLGLFPPPIEKLPRGVIVCTVDLVEVFDTPLEAHAAVAQMLPPGPELDAALQMATGPRYWLLRNPRHCNPPRSARGMPGLFDVDPNLCPACG
ncbi:MAG: ASCH domain-containing protein [Nitrospirota bacterium]|nr:ASCH domain-containing protein [Nitrospirota bacterium]